MSSPAAENAADAANTAPAAATASGTNTTAPPAAPSGSNAPDAFQTPSLYVGDLVPDINESFLFDIFSAVGPVASIRVCRDAVTRRSLGYAYVNFHQLADAERALDTMNFSVIKNKPCRIMWSQRDPSLRRSGVGNIFVKNLNEAIDNKQLYDTFSLFGNILSCKVVTDRESGSSKGYGYVHYETAQAANAAIEKLDGMLIDGQEVQVGHFMRRNDRPDINSWTNCYVKNIPYEWDDAKMQEEFGKFGPVVSASVARGVRKKIVRKEPKAPADAEDSGDATAEAKAEDAAPEAEAETPAPEDKEEKKTEEDTDQTLGYGFVNFAEHEGAAAAVEGLNGKEFTTTLNDETITQEMYVGRAQKKAERERELRAKFEAEKMDRISKFQGVNLYVKNLDDTVTDDVLRTEFASMGTITSCRIMRDVKQENRSRGFGFVCFSTPEEATRAVNEMNGKLVAGKPIFVALAQRREVRRAQLEAQHNNSHHHHMRGGAGMGMPGMMRGGPMGGAAGMGYPGMPMYMQQQQRGGAGAGGMQPAYPMMQAHMMGGGRGGAGGPRGGPAGPYPMMQQQPGRGGYPVYGMVPGGRGGGRGGRGGRGGPGMQQQGQPPQQQQQNIKFNQQARNAGGGANTAAPAPAHEASLTAAALASATPEVQKNMIGERLYPLIHNSQPELAGKITGMLLEMDNSELLHLLESPDALAAKISEALGVLKAHQTAASQD